ncbi:MAG: hypothetical protein GX359_03790 [Clostridiales bacterium]|nr:hypothetical protein [Clostridiales bacterium]
MTVKRKEQQVLLAIKQGDEPISFSCYSLPDDYSSASFDYDVLLVRKQSFISFILNCSYYKNIVDEDMI